MPSPTRIRKAYTCKLDASGAGQVLAAPPGQDWVITLVSVSTSTAAKAPTFKLYADDVSPAGFLEGTFSGDQDASDTTHHLQPGQVLYGVWTGGDANAIATMRISGWGYATGEAPTGI